MRAVAKTKSCLFALLVFLTPFAARPWGTDGHSMVARIAAEVLADQNSENQFLVNRAYELGYYANVPDLVWKSDQSLYAIESVEHFLDLEIFDREMSAPDWQDDRTSFFLKYKIDSKAGRAFWRVSELSEMLRGLSQSLNGKDKELDYKKKQLQWLIVAGVLGHYVGDLAQPLHCTENYDGQMTQQKGIHAYFEIDVLAASQTKIVDLVSTKAKKDWKAFVKQNEKYSPFELALQLCRESNKEVPRLLAIDKRVGRRQMDDATKAYENLLIERLSAGSLYLALIWSRNLDWTFRGEKFYDFDPKPKYIYPKTK